MKFINFGAGFLHCFIGLGAVAGGLGGILNPVSPLGIPPEVLANSPFHTFLIPGLFLFTVVGMGNLLSFIISRLFAEARGYLSGFMGVIQILWITIQCIFLQSVGVLHVIFFILGIVQGLLALGIIISERQWPADDLIFFMYRLRKNNK